MKALITGGAEGLGACLVRQLVGRGAQLCVLDIKAPAPHPAVTHIHADLARPDLPALTAALRAQGPFDLVVMSAGISAVGAFETLPLSDSLEVVTVNAIAPLIIVQQLVGHGLIANGGRLVFVASLSHRLGYPGASAYAASKDVLVGFARSIRRPLRHNAGVGVQVVLPGPMRTAHAARYAPPGSDGRGRIDPEIVARAILRRKRGFWIVPGAAAKLSAVFGRLCPQTATWLMRKMIYERLS